MNESDHMKMENKDIVKHLSVHSTWQSSLISIYDKEQIFGDDSIPSDAV